VLLVPLVICCNCTIDDNKKAAVFDVSNEGPSSALEMSKFCLYFSGTQAVDKLCSPCLFQVVVASLEQAVNNL
jgi:hypothetical protein